VRSEAELWPSGAKRSEAMGGPRADADILEVFVKKTIRTETSLLSKFQLGNLSFDDEFS
jgi:hypothetical protein